MVKRCQIYFIGLKKTCLGVLERGDREKYNETGLKEGCGIEMSTTVLPYTRCTLSSLKYLPSNNGLLYDHDRSISYNYEQ